jgi:hypothetical protein
MTNQNQQYILELFVINCLRMFQALNIWGQHCVILHDKIRRRIHSGNSYLKTVVIPSTFQTIED